MPSSACKKKKRLLEVGYARQLTLETAEIGPGEPTGMLVLIYVYFFFFNDTATTEIYTLSLHDALPITPGHERAQRQPRRYALGQADDVGLHSPVLGGQERSEEHTSELQSPCNLVC